MPRKIWFFEEVNLFNILCPSKMERHVEEHPFLHVQKGEFIFMAGDRAQEIYLVAEGRVKIGFYDESGNEHIKVILGRGEIFGEKSYLGCTHRTDFAQAMTNDTQICKMSAEKALDLSRSYVPFALTIHRKIADNELRVERRLEILFFKDVQTRLTELLKDLQATYAVETEEGRWVKHELSQAEMARLIGSSRKTVSLLLNALEDEGVLEQKPGMFKMIKGLSQASVPR